MCHLTTDEPKSHTTVEDPQQSVLQMEESCHLHLPAEFNFLVVCVGSCFILHILGGGGREYSHQTTPLNGLIPFIYLNCHHTYIFSGYVYVSMSLCGWACMWHGTCVEVKGQVTGVGSFYHVGLRLRLRSLSLVANEETCRAIRSDLL